nr:hypothetical protein [Tanacetum cinerariifolium]
PANLSTHTSEPSRRFNSICYDDDDDDDDEERTIPLRDIISQLPPNEELSTIPRKESDEFIKTSVKDLVPILKGKSMTFSNPLFHSNDDFNSSDDESLSDEDVPDDNIKIYLNLFFEFDDKYISSDVNPLFDKVLEDIESEDPYVSDLDEPVLRVTPLADVNEDECFDPGGDTDEIDAFLDIDTSMDINDGCMTQREIYSILRGDILYLESLLSDDTTTNSPPEVFLDRNTRSLSDINDLMMMVKVFDSRIHEKLFSLTYDCLDLEDSRAHDFVHRLLELLSLACINIWESNILDLIDLMFIY